MKVRAVDVTPTIAEQVDHCFSSEISDVYRVLIKPIQREICLAVLSRCNGNQFQAAKILGISRSTLRRFVGPSTHRKASNHVPS